MTHLTHLPILPGYIRIHHATTEMRRALWYRKSGSVSLDGCTVEWDTRDRRVTISGQSDCVEEFVGVVRGIANEANFKVE